MFNSNLFSYKFESKIRRKHNLFSEKTYSNLTYSQQRRTLDACCANFTASFFFPFFFFFAQPLTYDEQLNKKSVLCRTDQPTVLLESTPNVKD